MDCGPTCLRMVAKYYGRSISLDYLRNKSQYGKEGVSMLGLADAVESIGLKTMEPNLVLINSLKKLIQATTLWVSTFAIDFLPAYRIKNLTMARMLTIDKMALLKTNTNIHLIISALLSAISALEAKFLYSSSRRVAISCVTICCFFSKMFIAFLMYQIYVVKAKY